MDQKKARLIKVLKGEVVDRPPCICPGGMMNMITTDILSYEALTFPEVHHNSEAMARLAKRVYDENCFENYGVPFCMTIEAEAFGAKVDFGKNDIEPHVVEYCYDTVADWPKLEKPDHNAGRSKVVLDAIKNLQTMACDGPLIGNITGPISMVTSIMEPVVFYKELRRKREDAHKMMQVVTDSLVEFAKLQVLAGADVIAISDPSGTGEILGPKLFEEFVVPYVNQITDAVTAMGKLSIVHICGRMDKVYSQVNDIHTECLSFDALVNMKTTKDNLPYHRIMGNVSTYALEFGDKDAIKSKTKACIKQGVDIVAPACGLGMRSPIQNIKAIIEAAEEK